MRLVHRTVNQHDNPALMRCRDGRVTRPAFHLTCVCIQDTFGKRTCFEIHTQNFVKCFRYYNITNLTCLHSLFMAWVGRLIVRYNKLSQCQRRRDSCVILWSGASLMLDDTVIKSVLNFNIYKRFGVESAFPTPIPFAKSTGDGTGMLVMPWNYCHGLIFTWYSTSKIPCYYHGTLK